MASQNDAVAGATAPQIAPLNLDQTQPLSTEKALEMTDLPASPRTPNEEFKDAVQQQEEQPTSTTDAPPPPTLTRKETEALGPETDSPIVPTNTVSAGPTLNISLMLITGARHPYKIDEKYLKNRNVEAKTEGNFDPLAISGYQLKELIWTDWRSEWEPRPTSPSSIRLIILGKMVEDKNALREMGNSFKIDSTNVVHMTVKPADFHDDDETAGKGTKGVTRARDAEERGAGCRCVIL